MAHPKFNVKTLVSLWTLLFLLLFTDTGVGLGQFEEDTSYMLKLMKALTPTPPGWSSDTNICQWTGVSCMYSFPSVAHIDLSSLSLTGTLPPGLNSLSKLNYLNLQNNNLSGPFPSLANLTSLANVIIATNNFSSIPTGCFQGLTDLQNLSLSYNLNLAPWTFPTELTHSMKLNTLDLVSTNLMGFIPDIFNSFPTLSALLLSENNLTGILPNSFAQSGIATLRLDYQAKGLTGTIEVLSSMTDLSQAWLQYNEFEGPIPDLSNCTNLVKLDLHWNTLTGVVPHSLTTLPSLRNVSLGSNYLLGPVPVFGKEVMVSLGSGFCLDHVGPCDPRVTTLLEIAAAFGYPLVLADPWAGSNNPCQGWKFITCGWDEITVVNLTNLNLTGTISPAFGNLTDLWILYLGGNNLTGSLPDTLATLPHLEILDVSYNKLSGNIPRFSHKLKFNATGNVLLGTTPSSADPPHLPTSISTPWIAGASIASAGVIVIFMAVIYNRKRFLNLVQKMMFKKSYVDQNVEDLIKNYGSLAPNRYNYLEVKKMTNSFRDKIGEGGYGTVYKANLTDGRQVAVKVLHESTGSGEEFINEVASISRTSHVNIISLLGFCYEMNKRALIYEFMPNGSLDKFIYKKSTLNCSLDWSKLFRITISIARGLEYLHRGCNTRILHLDIKPQNILLDEDFCPKIADFGLAKICKKNESIVSLVSPRGTRGYIAPEVFSRTYGGVSHKSDVYSYGMLILEVVGGRKNYDTGGSHTSEMYFPDWIYKDLDEGNIPTRCLTNTDEEKDLIMKITLVSLWCVQPNPSTRPSMNEVIEMLEGPVHSVGKPPKPVVYSPQMSLSQFPDISQNGILETDSISAR